MKLKDRIIVGTLTIGAIFTIFFAILIAGAMSSCERIADRDKVATNQWRGVALKTGRHITVRNTDSMQVCVGDTVTVFYNESDGMSPAYYYIANIPDVACDTVSTEMYIDGKDTIYEKFEAWNVRLEQRVMR